LRLFGFWKLGQKRARAGTQERLMVGQVKKEGLLKGGNLRRFKAS